MVFPIRVNDVMSTPVYTTTPQTTAAEAATECFENDIGSLVVLDGDEIVGIVTGMDLLELLGSADEPGRRPLRKIMSAPVVTTTPETNLADAAVRMAENDVARLAVVDEGSLVGMISTDDITRHVPQVLHRVEIGDESATEQPEYRYNVRHETAYEKSDWEFECQTIAEEKTSVGDRVEFSKVISEQDVRSFAAASGDTNRLHLDEEYAGQTRFGHRIAHGTLVSGFISAALARLPGLTIYLSQDLSFQAPAGIGQRVTAVCEIVGSFGRNKYELTTDVVGEDGEQLIEGEATVLIDELPDTASIEIEAVA